MPLWPATRQWRSRIGGLCALLFLASCASHPPGQPPENAVASTNRTPPGAINEDVTQANIGQTVCVPGWTATVRPSTTYTNGVKAKLLREHGLPVADAAKYELDHFIPLALGGHPRKLENLWLQRWDSEWGAKKKDHLEVKLKVLVCSGRLSLNAARDAVRSDWKAAFIRYVGTLPPERGPQGAED